MPTVTLTIRQNVGALPTYSPSLSQTSFARHGIDHLSPKRRH